MDCHLVGRMYHDADEVWEGLKVGTHVRLERELDNRHDPNAVMVVYEKFAKTMPRCPHEYIVRGNCPLTTDEFDYFVHMQREHGVKEHWGKYYHPYLYIDNYKYWTMGAPVEETRVINRAKADVKKREIKE